MKLLSIALSSLVLAACGGGGGNIAVAPTAVELATSFLTSIDAAWATAVPASGAAAWQFADGCYLNDGYSKVVNIASFDANTDSSASSKYRIGATFSNLQVLADRSSTNSDGSSRRELDIQYQINYADGTINRSVGQTLITGSSAGSIMANGTVCSTPQADNTWRIFGNRRIVDIGLRAVNLRNQIFSLANGTPLAPDVYYSKYIQYRIHDPANVAKYVVVKGPGLPTSGVKMLSPRLLRDDTLLAGKRGNFVDYQDTDAFRFCRVDTTTGDVTASTADCPNMGAASNSYGQFNYTDPAALDTQFAQIGLVFGGSYTVDIHNDDGWKTVNGQVLQAPIASYTRTLNSLPYSAAVLAGTGVNSDLYPRLTSSLSTSAIANSLNAKTSFTTNLSWTAPGVLPDASKFGWGIVYFYEEGKTSTTSWPRSKQEWDVYPDAGALGYAGLTVPAPSSTMQTLIYGEGGIVLSNRNNSLIISMISFE